MRENIGIQDACVMKYTPAYQSDYAPELPNEDLSSAHSLRQYRMDRMHFE